MKNRVLQQCRDVTSAAPLGIANGMEVRHLRVGIRFSVTAALRGDHGRERLSRSAAVSVARSSRISTT